jgi:Calcineurin-like phosphoesterase
VDAAYDRGKAQEFQNFYAPTWGIPKIKTRTWACPGNHDYRSDGGEPYYDYFGERAGTDRTGHYSLAVAGWHIVSLNSEVDHDHDSEQIEWLRQNLEEREHPCILAFVHRQLFGSGGHEDDDDIKPFWDVLFEHRAEIVLCGHAHHYERFAPQRPDQTPDDRGIREFIVGTGGREFHGQTKDTPNSEVMGFDSFGVLKLTLHPTAYEWEFIPAEGSSFRDASVAPHPANHP